MSVVAVRTPLALGLLVLLAGCLGASTPLVSPPADEAKIPSPFAPVVPAAPSFDFRTVVNPDHGGHELPALHTVHHGVSLAGWTSVAGVLPAGMRGSITQVDVWNGYALVAGMEGGPAFVIVDLRDPAQPKPVSYVGSSADGWTARFSKDGQFVFYGCQMLGPPNAANGVVKGDCEDPNEVHVATNQPGGVSVYDVTDKTRPRFLDFFPVAGSHNIQTQHINGTDYVFTSSTAILKFDRAAGRLWKVAEVPGVHDATVVRHPVTGDWLLYTGGAQRTFAIYNVNDPANPSVVLEGGTVKDVVGWHDQVAFPYLVDGRALLALAGETSQTTSGGVPDKVVIMDITDPAKPVKLSEWQPPFMAQLPWVSYTFSVHEMAATPQGQLAVSWYHGGVWVIDLSTKERQAKPVTLGAFQPSKDVNVVPSNFVQTPVPLVPFVWSVAWDQRGYLVVPDMHTGVYVLKPAWGLHPMLDGGA